MATTSNSYTGNGSTVLFSFTFPYLDTTDIKVSLNGVNTTAYTLDNATTIRLNTAPASGVAIKIYRVTASNSTQAEFYPGSAIRATDLNRNFQQTLFVSQETVNTAASSTAIANSAVVTANTASATANTIAATASSALTNANAAVVTANAASANATTALSTANTAITTANAAATNASSAVTVSNAATVTANTASNVANTASSNASSAINAVSAVVAFPPIAAVANIPVSPTNGQGVQVNNSTGIESFTPLAGKPAGFVGDSGINVKIQYSTSGSTWNWIGYAPNDSDSRYLKLTGGTLTGHLNLVGEPTLSFHPTNKAYVDTAVSTLTTAVNATLPKAGGTMTGAITLAADPVSNLQPSTKQYVDSAITTLTTSINSVQSTANAALPKAGGTLTGPLTLAAAPTSTLEAATRGYVDSVVIPSGTTMLFVQASAPTGWTKVTTHNNKALRVVSGTGGGSGGSLNFTDVFANRGVPLPEHSHGVYDPGHVHAWGFEDGQIGGGLRAGSSADYYSRSRNVATAYTGIGIYNSGTPGASMDFSVAYVDTIIATKN